MKLTPKQRQVLRQLALLGTACQKEIVDTFGVSRFSVGHHIKMLRKKGLVDSNGYVNWVTKLGHKELE